MEIGVIRGKGIDNLVSGYSPRKVEEEKEFSHTDESKFNSLFNELEFFMERMFEEKIKTGHINQILTPNEIEAFLFFSRKYEKRQTYAPAIGSLLNILIQNSYNAGHNNFQLNPYYLKKYVRDIGWFSGSKEEPLLITLRGRFGDHTAEGLKYVNLALHKNTGNLFGAHSEDSKITLHGDCGHHSAHHLKASHFTVYGKCGEFSGNNAQRCTFLLAEVERGFGYTSKDCTFKTTNEDTIVNLMKSVPEKTYKDIPSGNKIVFVHPDGREFMMRDYREGSAQGGSIR